MNGEAKYLHDSELLNKIFDQIERDAVEAAINAGLGDDETRRNATGEARAIRSVRRKLKVLCAETSPRTDTVV